MADDTNSGFGRKDSKDLENLRSIGASISDSFRQTKNSLSEINDDTTKLSNILDKAGRRASNLTSLTQNQLRGKKAQKLIEQRISSINSIQAEVEANISNIRERKNNQAAKRIELDQEIRELVKQRRYSTTNESKALENQINKKRRLYEQTFNINDVEDKKVKVLQRVNGKLNDAAEAYQELGRESERIERNTSAFRHLTNFMGSLPGIGDMIKGPFEKAEEVAINVAQKGGGFFEVASKGSFELLTNLSNAITPATIIGSLLQATDNMKALATSVGTSQEHAAEFYGDMLGVANASNNTLITSTALVESQLKLTEQLGLGVTHSGDTLKNFTILTERLNVSEKSAGRITLLQEGIAKNSGDYVDNIAESAKISANLLGINVSLSDVYEQIGSASTTTLINFRRYPGELGETVARAKSFGAALSDIRDVSSGLLDFQQSISNELEAELLTGRKLDLNRARIAALKGDDLELTKQIASQVGTISEFENMSLISRESLAKAFNLNIDQLGDMLLKQEAITANREVAVGMSSKELKMARQISKEEGKSLGESLKLIEAESSATQKFQEAASQVKEAFQGIVVKVAPILTEAADLLARFLDSGLGKIATLSVATLSAGMKAIRGTRALPMITKEVGRMGGTPGGGFGQHFYQKSGYYKDGKRVKFRGPIPEGARLRPKGRLTRLGGSAIGMAAGLGGMALSSLAENASNEALKTGLSSAGGALSMGGTGAMIGSMIAPGIGTVVGGSIGAIVGGITSYLEEEKKQQREEAKKEREEFRRALREVAMKESKIYMSGNKVGNTITKESLKSS